MNSLSKIFLLSFTALSLATGSVHAATLVADPSNDDCADGSGGLQSCLDVAVDNGEPDTIQLKSGLYEDGFTYNAAISAEDQHLTLEPQGDSQPVIQGNAGSGITLISSGVGDAQTQFLVKGLRFQKGNFGNGGGMKVTFTDADLTVENCEFVENQATLGGAISVTFGQGGDGDVTLTDNLFSHNQAASSGGGVFVVLNQGSVTMQGNTFEGNSTDTFDGGAAHLETETGTLQISHNTLVENSSGRYGGALDLEMENGHMNLDANTFSKNTSEEAGGAVWVLALSDHADLNFTNNIFSDNVAGNDDDGQGVDAEASGGALFVEMLGGGTTLNLTNNSLVNNRAQDKGGALAVKTTYGTSVAQIYNNLFFGNIATHEGADLYVNEDAVDQNNASQVKLFNNLYAGLFSECLEQGGDCVTMDGNILNQDPRFTDVAAQDFTLLADSPAIDHGTENAPAMPAVDFLGQARPAPETAPDMGALEYQPPAVDAPPAADEPADEVDASSGGCSLGSGANGSTLSLCWLGFGLMGLFLRKKSR